MFYAFLDTGAHGRTGRELRLLLEQTDVITGLEVHVTVELRIASAQDAHERGFAGTVETEHADLRAVEKRQRDVAEDFLALDFLRDADHRENDFGSFVGLRHGRAAFSVSAEFQAARCRRAQPLRGLSVPPSACDWPAGRGSFTLHLPLCPVSARSLPC